jgi:pilus assembly protein CpaF
MSTAVTNETTPSDGWRRQFTVSRDYYRQFGPIDVLLRDDRVTEVMVMGEREIYVEVEGKIHLTDFRFKDQGELLAVIGKIAQAIGRQIDEDSPLCDARLADGSRVHMAIKPAALDGPYLTIRKFAREPLTADQLVEWGSCTREAFTFLKACVEAKANILISGGSGTGKTTLLNILSAFIPPAERIVTIEDAAELQLRQRHVARLETRPPSLEGKKPITIRDLVITSLRMRPDRIIVGECRGSEALDMIQAMNTGHEGSMTTVHANSPRDALSRLETMVLMAGYDLPTLAIRQQAASAIDILIQIARMREGARKVVQICELTGMEEGTISMQDIFVLDAESGSKDHPGPRLTATGLRPRILDRLAEMSIEPAPELAALFPAIRPAGKAGKVRWEERF